MTAYFEQENLIYIYLPVRAQSPADAAVPHDLCQGGELRWRWLLVQVRPPLRTIATCTHYKNLKNNNMDGVCMT